MKKKKNVPQAPIAGAPRNCRLGVPRPSPTHDDAGGNTERVPSLIHSCKQIFTFSLFRVSLNKSIGEIIIKY